MAENMVTLVSKQPNEAHGLAQEKVKTDGYENYTKKIEILKQILSEME